jgi:cell division protein FtsA
MVRHQEGNYIFSLDVGSSFIRGVVGEILPNLPLQIIASVTKESQGIRKGQIFDYESAVDSITQAIEEISNTTGQKSPSFIVSISGPHIESISSRGVVAVSRADGEITEDDVQRAIKAAQAFSLPKNKEIIHIIPKEFIVDKERGIRDPIGMHGVRLEVECEVILASSSYINSFTKAIEESGGNISGMVFSTLAASEAVLSKRQKELGVLVLDVGGSSTGMCVFEEGNLLSAAVLPIGASHITNDIAIAFQVPIETAEKIKLKYGMACHQDGSEKRKEEISLKEFDQESNKKISRKKLIDVIEARIQEILELVNKELKRIGRERLLPGGVILTGGGAKMPRMEEIVKKELHLPCQIGFPTKVEGIVDKIDDPGFASSIGLLLWELKEQEKEGGFGFGKKFKFAKNLSRFKKWLEELLP